MTQQQRDIKLSDEELSSIDVPVRYLVGENERICDPQAAVTRLASVAPRIETALIKGAGHDAVWVRTDAVRERLMAFVGES